MDERNPMNELPIERSYWAVPGRLLAGAFPGYPDEAKTLRRIRAFLETGIRTFVNLMQPDEVNHHGQPFRPYDRVVETEARAMGVGARCLRFPIVDLSIPDLATMDAIRAALDEAHRSGAPAYVHCWGGKGRTGQVVGVHLIEHGHATHADFVETIARLRQRDPGGGRSPETPEQIEFVRRYAEARGLGSA